MRSTNHLRQHLHLCGLLGIFVGASLPGLADAQEPIPPAVAPASSSTSESILLISRPAARSRAPALLAGETLRDRPWLAIPLEAYVDPMRRWLIPAVVARTEAARNPRASCGSQRSFSEVIFRAENALLFLRYEQLAAYLTELFTLLPCSEEHVEREQLARLLTLQGLLELREGKPATALEDALALFPAATLPVGIPDTSASAWQQAMTDAARRPTVSVELQLENSLPWALAVNGLRVEGTRLTLPTGRHFLQWLTPEGTALVGEWVTLEVPRDDAPVRWPPPSLQIPSREDVLARLEQDLTGGVLAADLRHALDQVSGGHALQVVSPGTVPGTLELRVLSPRGLETSGPARSLPSARGSKMVPPALTGALAGLTAGAALAYVHLAQQSSLDDALPDDIEQRNFRLAQRVGVSAGVLAVGTGLSLWWSWQSSGPAVGVRGKW